METGLSLIIPVFNKWELTRQCLLSLARCVECDQDGEDLEILVVDNGSSDATATRCAPLGASLFGVKFQVVRLEKNRNFSGACNFGAQLATGRRLFFLNNDTLVVPGWRAPLETSLTADTKLAGVGPMLLYPDLYGFADRIQHLGVVFGPNLRVSHLHEGLPAAHRLCTRVRRFQAITAAALCMDRGLFLDAGGFDEAFVNGFEDVDLCATLHARGFSFGIVPTARVYHLCGQTPGRNDHDQANAQLLNQKGVRAITPDRQQILAEDGLRLRLGPWLDWEVAPESARLREVERRLRQQPEVDTALALLREEPYWQAGYAWLAEELARKGQEEEGLCVALLAARIESTPATQGRVLQLALRCNRSKAFAELAAHLRNEVQLAESRVPRLRKLRKHYRGRFPELVADVDALLATDAQFRQGELAALRQMLAGLPA